MPIAAAKVRVLAWIGLYVQQSAIELPTLGWMKM